jgi:hypothetical protein
MPKGFLTEDGPRPEFADLYGAAEMPTAEYKPRTVANVRDADAVVWFGDRDTPGGKATHRACSTSGVPVVFVRPGESRPSHVAGFLRANRHVKALMVAGNRESKSPGIGARVERFMAEVLRQLGHGPAPDA